MSEDNTINGVELPAHVAEELRRLGMPLFSYTAHQLEVAKQAATIDCRVVEDDAPDNPGDLDDMMELTTDELEQHTIHGFSEEKAIVTGMVTAGVGGVAALPGLVGGFVAKLLEDRATRQAFQLLEPFPAFSG